MELSKKKNNISKKKNNNGNNSGVGGLNSNGGLGAGQFDDSIGVYSFALKPEEHQPSGTCNFSRIDNAQLQFTINEKSRKENKKWISSNNYDLLDDNNKDVTVYAINYNYLLIKSGMAGLAYST